MNTLANIQGWVFIAALIFCVVMMEVWARVWIKESSKETKYKPFTYTEIFSIKGLCFFIFANLSLWAVTGLGWLCYGIYLLVKGYFAEILIITGSIILLAVGIWLFLYLNKKWLDKVAKESYEEYSAAKKSLGKR